jgi:hypothetical protein
MSRQEKIMGRRLESHRDLFHAVSRIEPILLAWSTKHPHKKLDDIFWHDIPTFRRQEIRTFGDFMDGMDSIARKYSCTIHPASDEARAMPINGREAYAMAMHLLVSALGSARTLKRTDQMTPVIQDIVSMIETWGQFKHAPYGTKLDFDKEFVYYAKGGFVGSGADIDDFNVNKAQLRATKVREPLKLAFSKVSGEFGNQMLSFAVIVAGDDHGVVQAKSVLGDDFEP